jgi:hypothetical protein
MADQAAPASAPAKVASPPANPKSQPPTPPEKGEKKDDSPNKFAIAEASKFTIDNMLVQGSVEVTLKLQEKVTATYRTLSVEDIQKVENVMPLTEMREKSLKFLQNEMTIAQLYYSLIALNGKPLPPAGDGGKEDKRMAILRNLPGVLFDILVQGFSEFDRRAQALVSGENLKNF